MEAKATNHRHRAGGPGAGRRRRRIGNDQLWRALCRMAGNDASGSLVRRRTRRDGLRAICDRLARLGYRDLAPGGIKDKHVWALVEDWKRDGMSTGRMKNLMTEVRWWARAVGRGSVVMSENARYGIANRRMPRGASTGVELDPGRLALVVDERVRFSLELQSAFGLRREEAMKFRVAYADRGGSIVLKASWCKGGRARTVPVVDAAQRALLDRLRAFAGGDSLIPPGEKYVQQMGRFERETRRAGISRTHALRYGYAQRRYLELAGQPCPAAGGTPVRSRSLGERQADRRARVVIARELGHGRLEIVAVYVGL